MESEEPTIDRPESLKHIAIIMDGNGRWATNRGEPRIEGHRRGADVVRDITTACRRIGLTHLTLYSFSVQNWQRPPEEVAALMNLLRDYCIGERELFVDNDIRFNVIGRLDRVPVGTRKAIESLIETTESHRSMMLTLAIDYGGREEILRATRKIARLIEEGALDSESIDENVFESQLDTAWTPPPDLLIRTSGELRISNFLLWQLAYSEFYFTERNWPDFSVEDLAEAVESFAMRERRFGETSEQVNMATQGEET